MEASTNDNFFSTPNFDDDFYSIPTPSNSYSSDEGIGESGTSQKFDQSSPLASETSNPPTTQFIYPADYVPPPKKRPRHAEKVFIDRPIPLTFPLSDCDLVAQSSETTDAAKVSEPLPPPPKRSSAKNRQENDVNKNEKKEVWVCEGCRVEFNSSRSIRNHLAKSKSCPTAREHQASLEQVKLLPIMEKQQKRTAKREEKKPSPPKLQPKAKKICLEKTTEKALTPSSKPRRPIFRCSFCRAFFFSQVNLDGHIKDYHPPASQPIPAHRLVFKCDFCPKAYASLSYLRIHLRSLHFCSTSMPATTNISNPALAETPSQALISKCPAPACDRRFFDNYSMANHIRQCLLYAQHSHNQMLQLYQLKA